MPRKKPSRQYKTHGWRRHTEHGENLTERLCKEFDIEKSSKKYWEELLEKDRI